MKGFSTIARTVLAICDLLFRLYLWYILDMNTITIPKNLIKKGFVVLPRQEYESLLRAKQGSPVLVKRRGSTKKHQEFYTQLDKDLTIAFREAKAGKNLTKSFNTANKAIKFLDSRVKVSKK